MLEPMEERPALSVAVVAGARRERVHRVLRELAAQTVASKLDVVLVDLSPDHGSLRLPSRLGVRVIEAPGETFGGARALAAHAARADALAYLEEHCCPDRGWAQALIEAHSEPNMVIGYSFEPVNPRTRASRASFLASYGEWMDPAPGPVVSLPCSNVSYERSLLLEAGDELPNLLEVDFNFYPRLLDAGARLAAEPSARVAHENEERLSDALRTNYNFSRVLAAERARVRVPHPARRAVQAARRAIRKPFAEARRPAARHHAATSVTGSRYWSTCPTILGILLASALGVEPRRAPRSRLGRAPDCVLELDAPRRLG